MTPYDSLFSRMGAQLAGSAIRQMGILAAGRPDGLRPSSGEEILTATI